MVIAVGNEKPVATTDRPPFGSMRTMRPVPSSDGPGNPGAVIDSRTYMRSRVPNTTPSTVVSPVAQTFISPLGVTLKIEELPGTTGKVLRLPTKKLPL